MGMGGLRRTWIVCVQNEERDSATVLYLPHPCTKQHGTATLLGALGSLAGNVTKCRNPDSVISLCISGSDVSLEQTF